MQACTIQQVDRLITSASIRLLLCLFALAFLLLATERYSLADPGLINRTPITKQSKPKTKLDKLADSLGDIVKSIDQIVAEPGEGEFKEELIISEPIKKKAKPVQTIAKPVPKPNKPIKSSAPVTASPAIPKPVPSKAADKTSVKMPVDKITAVKEEPASSVNTAKKKISKPAYQKLSIAGEELNEDAKQWACVEDTQSGLIWEVKDSNGGLRDKKHSYSWFDPSHENLQGIADGGRCKGGIQCDTNAYIQALNTQNFCGHSDWRLPTREEIQQLVDLGNNRSQATINKDLFPDTVPSWYWTSSSNASNPGYAWYVLFRNGISLNDLKQRPKHIRLVRTNKKA